MKAFTSIDRARASKHNEASTLKGKGMKVRKLTRFRNIFFIVMVLILASGGVVSIVFAGRTSPAQFEMTNLTISPNPAEVDATITITVDVANSGGTEGEHSATLTLGGENVDSQKVTVPPGQARRITFRAIRVKAEGDFEIAVDGLSDTLKVIAPQ